MPRKKSPRKKATSKRTPSRGQKRPHSADKKKAESSKKRATSRVKSFFPIQGVHELMEQKFQSGEVKPEAAIFACGIMEYLAAEVLELSINVGRSQQRIPGQTVVLKASDVETAIRRDAELSQLMDRVRGNLES